MVCLRELKATPCCIVPFRGHRQRVLPRKLTAINFELCII